MTVNKGVLLGFVPSGDSQVRLASFQLPIIAIFEEIASHVFSKYIRFT